MSTLTSRMKVIRINWKLLKLIFLLLVSIYLLKKVLNILFNNDYASLAYDHEKRCFQIRVNDLVTRRHNLVQAANQADRVLFQIRGVSFIYSKTPVQLWTQLLENAVNLGVNTIVIDIPWYLHHTYPNVFKFTTNNLDLETFIKLVEHYKLYLIVRVDPFYAASGYDLGGVPAWLLGELDLESREKSYLNSLLNINDEKFQVAYGHYLDELFSVLKQYQISNRQGPLIGVLVQTSDPKLTNKVDEFYNIDYIDFIQMKMYRHDLVELLLTSRSSCENPLNIDSINNYQLTCDPNLDILVPLDGLEEKLVNNITSSVKLDSDDKIKSNFKELNRLRKSFLVKNFYPGVNFDSAKHLIKENGELTREFKRIKQVLVSNADFIDINHEVKLETRQETELKMSRFLPYDSIIESIGEGLSAKTDKNSLFIEYLSTDHGLDIVYSYYIIYSLDIELEKNSLVYIKSNQISDHSMLVCNQNEHILTIEASMNQLIVVKLETVCEQLNLIVENSGRSSRLESRKFYTQRKGMLKSDTILFKKANEMSETSSNDWKVFTVNLNAKNLNKLYPNSKWSNKLESSSTPFMAYASFNVNKTLNSNGVYLSMKKWSRGVCVLNGIVLGQYSAEKNFYIPSFYLNSGPNDLVIFEMVKSLGASVFFKHHL